MEIKEFRNKLSECPATPVSETDIDIVVTRSINASKENKTQAIGESYNLMIAMEELSELIQAISKFQRNGKPNTKDDLYYTVLEEYADVSVVMHYIEQIVGLDQSDIDKAIHVKLDRLDNKLYESGCMNKYLV